MAPDSPQSPGTPRIESAPLRHLKLRFAIFALTLAVLIGAYQVFQRIKDDPSLLIPAKTVGMIAALEFGERGSQAVIFNSDGSKLSSPGYVAGKTDRDLAWQLDGNRLFFSSDRDKDTYQIFRWNPSNGLVEVRSLGSRSKAKPRFGPPGFATDPGTALIIEGGFVLEMDTRSTDRRQLLPPLIQAASSAEEGAGSQFEAMYRDLGQSFKEAKFGKARESVVAVMRRDSGEVLIVQSFVIEKDANGEQRYPQPMPILAGKRIEFDVSADGQVVVSVLGAQRLRENIVLQPGEKAPPAPNYTNALLVFDPSQRSQSPTFLFASTNLDEAIVRPRFSPDGKSVFALAGKGSDAGNVAVASLLSMPIANQAIAQATELSRAPISDYDVDPTGATLVFAARINGKGILYTVPSAGGEQKRISPEGGDFGEPRFSPQMPK